jgi:hypothetical protein
LNEPTTEIPTSRMAVARIVLDVLLGGFTAALPIYMAGSSTKLAVLTGLLVAGKTLQSRMAPDLATMNRQRQAQKDQDSTQTPASA